MIFQGHMQNGVVILDEAPSLPDGTPVRVEVVDADQQNQQPRRGGQYAGQILMALDFDQWPADMQEALGMTP